MRKERVKKDPQPAPVRKQADPKEGELRLNKFLADAGVCARRKADELLASGAGSVNGTVVTELGGRVHLSDLVTVHGKPVNAEKHLTYIVLNKPKDYITTTNDELERKTVMDLIPLKDHRLFPVGRLDRNTTGVLILTNDGELANRLMHPSYEVPRMYVVRLDKYLQVAHAREIAHGVELEDGMTGESEVAIDPEDKHTVFMQLKEGRNREIRRIFEHFGYEVEKLDRKQYANITNRGMKRGDYRHLTREEVRELRAIVGLEDTI